MTGPENLMYTARLNGIPDKEAKVKALELMKRVGLEDQLKKKTGSIPRYETTSWAGRCAY